MSRQLRTLIDPRPQHRNFGRRKPFPLRRHDEGRVLTGDKLNQMTLAALDRHNRRLPRLAAPQQRLPPDQIVRNFSDSCRGKIDERNEVANNQATFTITSYSVDPNPPVDIEFGSVCRDRGWTGDACAYVPVRWESVYKSDGKRETATGTDQVNAIYENNRWRLCDSDFIGTTRSGLRFRK